jgi:ABC-type Fe3+ transport system permease subunit
VIARLLRNPAAILLAAIVLVAVVATVWAVGVVVEDTGEIWLNPEPSEEAIAQYRVIQIAGAIAAPATLVGLLALLGVIIVGAVTSRAVDADQAGHAEAVEHAGR